MFMGKHEINIYGGKKLKFMEINKTNIYGNTRIYKKKLRFKQQKFKELTKSSGEHTKVV